MSDNPQFSDFDQIGVQRAVHCLSRTGVRATLSVERIKHWVKQFETPAETTLAWLILRHLIFRTDDQLMSSMRQALKRVTLHFMDQQGLSDASDWRDALNGGAGLKFYCGPPSLAAQGFGTPGKSGELVARLVNQRYRIDKWFPSGVAVLRPDERFIVVDDGTYTGSQLCTFLRGWDINFSEKRVAIAVSMAHKTACGEIKQAFPDVPIFYGELLASEMCFVALCRRWVEAGQWRHEPPPLDVYEEVYKRHQPFDKGNGPGGYGDIGALVAFEHGAPDDSIQLLWDCSPTWRPLFDRGT